MANDTHMKSSTRIDQDDITRAMIRKVVEDLVVEALQKTFDVYKAVNEGNRQMIAEAVKEYMDNDRAAQQQRMQQQYQQMLQQQQRWPNPRDMYGQALANAALGTITTTTTDNTSPLDRFKFWK